LIEQEMVRRMRTRALVLAPVVAAPLALLGGVGYAISALAGLAMTLANLYLAARIIGGVAERAPQMLMAAALMALALGLFLLTALAVGLRSLELIYFPVTGFVLIGSHLLLVLWEAPTAYQRIEESNATSVPDALQTRS
jgi:protein-S-isoprenylcysteine O-methyltransferase Ste14